MKNSKRLFQNLALITLTLCGVAFTSQAMADGGNGSDYSGPNLAGPAAPSLKTRNIGFTLRQAESALKKCYGIEENENEINDKATLAKLMAHQLVQMSAKIYNHEDMPWYERAKKSFGGLSWDHFLKQKSVSVYSTADFARNSATSIDFAEFYNPSSVFYNTLAPVELEMNGKGFNLRLMNGVVSSDAVQHVELQGIPDPEIDDGFFRITADGFLPQYKFDKMIETTEQSALGGFITRYYLTNLRVESPNSSELVFYAKLKNPKQGNDIKKQTGLIIKTQEYTDCLKAQIQSE